MVASPSSKMLATRQFGNAIVEVCVGDLATQSGIDAVVNPTTRNLTFSGGVGSAILAQCDSKSLADACALLVPLEPSGAATTPSFGLPSPNIIHCYGPHRSAENASDELRYTLCNVLSLAEEAHFASVALPAVSAGKNGFTLQQAAQIAIQSIKSMSPMLSHVSRIRFVLPTQDGAQIYAEELLRQPQLPTNKTLLNIRTIYEREEFQAMKQGYPCCQDTKWDIIYEEPWLCFYRASMVCNQCHFWLKLPEDDCPGPFAEAWASGELPDPDQPWTKSAAEDLLQHLLDERFQLVRISAAKRYAGSACVWPKREEIIVEGGSLTPQEARELAQHLLSISATLDKAHS